MDTKTSSTADATSSDVSSTITLCITDNTDCALSYRREQAIRLQLLQSPHSSKRLLLPPARQRAKRRKIHFTDGALMKERNKQCKEGLDLSSVL